MRPSDKNTPANQQVALVVTTVSKPQSMLKALAAGSGRHHWDFIVVGDESSPAGFRLPGCEYYDLYRQSFLGFQTAKVCLKRHYARKNIGYLIAMRKGVDIIVETDDDNMPLNAFWQVRKIKQTARVLQNTGWVNVYQFFTDRNIWPRGFPLEQVKKESKARQRSLIREVSCPIQQGLVNLNPDVDAIFRMTSPLPHNFRQGPSLALGRKAWSPFNSQNTTWWKDAFALMYLPGHCSFRMTDIWRSYIAQRIAWENRWNVLFHRPSVFQRRNQHNLMRDFADEIPGYLNAENIRKELESLAIPRGVRRIPAAMRVCYERLVKKNFLDERELPLLECWLKDVATIAASRAAGD